MNTEENLVKRLKEDLMAFRDECNLLIEQLDRGHVSSGGILQNSWRLFMDLGRLQMLKDAKKYKSILEE